MVHLFFFCGDIFVVHFDVFLQRRWRFLFFDEYNSQYGWTALIWAALKSHTDCLRLLIDAGANKDARDDVRCWSLLCCCPFSFQVFCALFICMITNYFIPSSILLFEIPSHVSSAF